jgi:aminoglycoside phosphotransferase (APT) family kinase protein
VDEVHDLLAARVPDQQKVAVVHGDYRLDNCMVSAEGRVVAVLDWEICTLGDPLADLGLLLVYWTGPNDEPSAWVGPATTAPGFPDRDALVARYGAVTGRDLSQLDFYTAFGFWKLACILEGVYARYLAGAMGAGRDPGELDVFRWQVERAAAQAAEYAGRLT